MEITKLIETDVVYNITINSTPGVIDFIRKHDVQPFQVIYAATPVGNAILQNNKQFRDGDLLWFLDNEYQLVVPGDSVVKVLCKVLVPIMETISRINKLYGSYLLLPPVEVRG